MSFILDALRKSELERQRQSGPSVAELPIARDDRRLPIALVAIGVLLAVNVAVLLYFMMRDGREPAAPLVAAPETSAAPPLTSPPATTGAPAAAAAATGETLADMAPPQEPAARPPDARDPTLLPEAPVPDSGSVDYYDDPPAPVETLPMADAADLPALAIDLHIYADDPAKRAVFINGRRYTEGATLAEGPVVEEITPDGVVLRHRGHRFQLSRH